MKNQTLLAAFFLILMVLISCKKENTQPEAHMCGCDTPPRPVNIVILDSEGNNILKSEDEFVRITYVEDKLIKTLTPHVANLAKLKNDTIKTKAYGEFFLMTYGMGELALQDKPVNTFDLKINDQLIGKLHFEYNVVQGYRLPVVKLDDIVSELDTSVRPMLSVIRLK